MINVYFSPKIYSIADDLIRLATPKLIHSHTYPKHYALVELGIVTLLEPGEQYPMHGDPLGTMNVVTFLNSNGGGMRFEHSDIKAYKGLSIKFSSSIRHQPYANDKNRWALLQRI